MDSYLKDIEEIKEDLLENGEDLPSPQAIETTLALMESIQPKLDSNTHTVAVIGPPNGKDVGLDIVVHSFSTHKRLVINILQDGTTAVYYLIGIDYFDKGRPEDIYAMLPKLLNWVQYEAK